MKVLTANRLTDGRVIYWGAEGRAAESLSEALWLDGEEAEAALATALGRPELFVNPYLVEVNAGEPSGRDRFREFIRSTGPTVGHSRPGVEGA